MFDPSVGRLDALSIVSDFGLLSGTSYTSNLDVIIAHWGVGSSRSARSW